MARSNSSDIAAASESAGSAGTLGLRERGKRQRIERILDAALALLREDPEQNLTVDRIAARAEVAPMTVFNLVGNRDQLWSALADRALQDLDIEAISAGDPQERARRIVDAVVRILCADAAVFRALLSGWSHGGNVLNHDPTEALIGCLREAADAGQIGSGVNLRRHGEVMAAGLLGTIHQWTAGLLSDRAFRTRARAVVDVAFGAARRRDESRKSR
jgi:AcrR family transcriptional regulator